MIPHALKPTRRTAMLFVVVVATLLAAIVFDMPAFATALFPAFWIAFGLEPRCRRAAI